jgi:hypothetical protein
VLALANDRFQRYQPSRWQRLANVLRDYDGRLGAREAKKWRAGVRARLAPDSRELGQWDALFSLEPLRPGGVFNLIRKTES